ncbi:putative Alternative RNA polymerase sigma factor sigM [Cupriavidus taiwanensis]|nr:putative Alternative RNA polymerase sigma factor sigM [Cupriavidus taiwanensis]
MRYRGGGRACAFLPVRGAPGPAARHHQPVRDPRHGRAGRTPLLHHRRALRRGRGAAPGPAACGGAGRGARRQGRRTDRRAGGQQPQCRAREQAAGAGHRRARDRQRPAGRYGRAHREDPGVGRGARRGEVVPGEAHAVVAAGLSSNKGCVRLRGDGGTLAASAALLAGNVRQIPLKLH